MAARRKKAADDGGGPDIAALEAACSNAESNQLDAAAWERAKNATLTALRLSRTGAEIDATLAMVNNILDGAFLGEGHVWPEVADAMFDRAEAMSDAADVGKVLSWVIFLGAFRPTVLMCPKEWPGLVDPARAPFLTVVARHAARLRSWLSDAASAKRVGAAFVLGLLPAKDGEVAALLLDRAKSEKHAGSLGTEILALSAHAHRLRDEGVASRTRALATASLSHADAMVRLCAGIGLALLVEELPLEAAAVLVDHIGRPEAVPEIWWWSHRKFPPKSNQYASAVLAWARCRNPEPLVERLLAPDAAAALSPQGAEGLFRLAFDSRGLRIAPETTCVSDLDALSLRVLRGEGLSDRAKSQIATLAGFHPKEAPKFLAHEEVAWRPVEVSLDGKKLAWHFWRIWGAVLHGEATAAWGAKTILGAYSPADAANLVSRISSVRQRLESLPVPDALWEREQDLAQAVIDGACDAGFDTTAVLDWIDQDEASRGQSPASRDWYLPIGGVLGLALLRRKDPLLRKVAIQLVASAASTNHCVEPLRSLIASLPDDRRRAVLAGVWITPSKDPTAFRFLDLGLDEPKVLQTLVATGFSSSGRNNPACKRAFELLASAPPEVAERLERLEFHEMFRERATTFIAEVGVAIRARESRGPSG